MGGGECGIAGQLLWTNGIPQGRSRNTQQGVNNPNSEVPSGTELFFSLPLSTI